MSSILRRTVAQALIQFLSQQYIELDGSEYKFFHGILGIFGHGQVCGIGQALEQNPGLLKYYRIQNEQAGVHIAIGAAKHLNRLGCFAVTSSIGPGATNMITGAATATVNHIPVLLLPGDVFADRQPDPVLQQIENPSDASLVANDCFRPVCKYWDRINRPEQLMSATLNAMRILTNPEDTGAVCLGLPQDVQAETYEFPTDFFKKRIYRIDRRPLSRESTTMVVNLCTSKKRPLIISGGGIHYSLATESLQNFVEVTKIPVAFTNAGNSALRWDHPQNLGGIGVMGTAVANLIAQEADLVIAIGTRLMDFTTISKAAFQNPNVTFVAINVSDFDASKMNAIPLLADAKDALDTLKTALHAINYQVDASYLQEYTQKLKEWHLEVDRIRKVTPKTLPYLPQPAVIGILNEFLDETDVVINAAGSTPGDLQRTWRSKGTHTYHVEYGYSCMGYEIAAGLGVKLVDPSREVYIIQGDGGYLMMHTEIVTSLMENRKIIILLFDSEGFNSINSLSTSLGSNGFGNELRFRNPVTDLLNGPPVQIDYALNAQSYGAIAYTVHSFDELKTALINAKKSPRTTLIHIKIEQFSQTGGYYSWWRVGVAGVSTMPKVKKAYQEMEEKRKKARKY